MNLLQKKGIATFSVLLILILVISSFFVRGKAINVDKKTVTSPEIVAPVNAKVQEGSIEFEENDFFKKYTINSIEDIGELALKEDSDGLQITLKKSQILNADIKNGVKVNVDEFNSKDYQNMISMNFKKLTANDNSAHIDFQDKKKILVFIRKKDAPYKYKVVVDPGHGGIDAGASSGKLLEKDLTFKISKYMVDNLRYNGCNIVFTRNSDIVLDRIVKADLIKRATFANDEKADIFVSVHINSNNVNVYNGVSTYYYSPLNFQKAERTKLAQTIQKEILKNDEWKNMGERNENLAVLRLTTMPSALVECGFITNASDRDKLSSEGTLINFGLNISNGIINYLAETNSGK